MKIWISYFYQVRNMEPNMIPFSTAMWDPKWFHNFEDQNKIFVDNRGVINGLRLPQLVFPKDAYDYLIEIDSACDKDCKLKPKVEHQIKQNKLNNNWQTFGCKFMDRYFDYLWDNVNYDDLICYFEKVANNFSKLNGIEDPEIVLLVHEAPSNPCSERQVLIHWFEEFGYKLEEWNPYE